MKFFFYSCNTLTQEEHIVKSSLLDVFMGSFVRKPNFPPEDFFPGLQVSIEVM